MVHSEYPREFILRMIEKALGAHRTDRGQYAIAKEPLPTSPSALAVSIALLTGKPDREIWEKLPDKCNYAGAMAIYLSEMGAEEVLEGFLKDSEVMTYLDEQALGNILDTNPKLKNVLTQHYLGTSTKTGVRAAQKEECFVGTNIQWMLTRYLLQEKQTYRISSVKHEYEDDKDLTLSVLYSRLEGLLKDQTEKITQYNINSLRIGDWLQRGVFGRTARLSTLLDVPVEDDGEVVVKYLVEITKTENEIKLYPSASVCPRSLVYGSQSERTKQMLAFRKLIQEVLLSHPGKYEEMVIIEHEVLIKPEMCTIIPYERSITW